MVGVNKSFAVADHDFSKVSLIPDAIFVQDIPEPQDDKPADEYLHGDSKNSWFRRQVYYGVKNMVTQASTALRGVAEMGKILDLDGSQASRFFCYNRWWRGSANGLSPCSKITDWFIFSS